MSVRPDLTAELNEGETLLWKGHPMSGRPLPRRKQGMAALFFVAALLAIAVAGALASLEAPTPAQGLAVYALVGAAGFFTYAGLRASLLERRRAHARDRHTTYAITDRRALLRAGPFGGEVVLEPGVTARAEGDVLTISGTDAQLRFERIADAASVRDIIETRTGGAS